MASTMTKISRLHLTLPIACLGLALGLGGHAYAQQGRSTAGCAQKSDQEQYPNGPQMAQQAGQEQTGSGPSYTAQKTQGLPPGLYEQSQPHPTFPQRDARTASNDQSAARAPVNRPCG
jgi:hypothetical protein